MTSTAAFVILAAFPLTAAREPILAQEPALGALRYGQRVMVDDGSCPRGQIKLVIGGSYKPPGFLRDFDRLRECVPRSKRSPQ